MPALIRKFVEAKERDESSVTCWGTGSALREFMHVDDLGNAVLFILENWDPEIQRFNIKENKYLTYLNVGTGKDITIKELALKIAHIVDFKGEIIWDKSKPDGTPKKQLDISRIKSIGWEPTIELDRGIEKTISIYKQRGCLINLDKVLKTIRILFLKSPTISTHFIYISFRNPI